MPHIFGINYKIDHRPTAIVVIVAFFIMKIMTLPLLSLSGDESYGLVTGRSLELSYFAHPPLHQWIAHFSALIFGENEWARIPFIFLFALASWFIFLAAESAFNAQAGLIAVFCLNASWDMLTGAGLRILPSNPLMFSFSLTLWALSRLTLSRPSSRESYILWLIVGFALGLSALSKYHAIFVAFGILIFLAVSPRQRHWFKNLAPYTGALVALIVTSPVLLWNWQNEWVSFRFQGSRIHQNFSDNTIALQISDLALHFNLIAPIEVLWALVGKLTPWIAFPLALAVIDAVRNHSKEDHYLIFFCTGLPIIGWFVFAPIFGTAIGHSWSLPGVFFLYPLLGNWLLRKNQDWKISFTKISTAIVTLSIIIIGVMGSNDRTGWIGEKIPFMTDAATRFTLGQSFQNLGNPWLRREVEDARASFVITSLPYSSNAKVAIALGRDVPVLSQSSPHGLYFIYDQSDWIGKDGIIVSEEKNLDATLRNIVPLFEATGPVQTIEVYHTLWATRKFVLIRGYRLKGQVTFPDPTRKS